MDQLSLFEMPATPPPPAGKAGREKVSPGLRRYAVIRKTYPKRRTPRAPYIFLLLIDTWNAKKDQLAAQAQHGGPSYELLTTIEHTTKWVAARQVREMYPGETVYESELI